MKTLATVTALFAILVMTGGLIGFFVAGSLPSLIASSIFGTLFLVGAIALYKNHAWGYWVTLLLAVNLFLFFVFRYTTTYATMPLVMAIVSFAFSTYLFQKRTLGIPKTHA